MTTLSSARGTRARNVRFAGLASLAVGAMVLSPLGFQAANADPAPAPANRTLGTGAFSVTPAAGSCGATVTLEGGNGGDSILSGINVGNPAAPNPDLNDPNQNDPNDFSKNAGQGARITFTIPLSPGDVLEGVVGTGGSDGGAGGTSGTDKGGVGGAGTHMGGGGGGYTSFEVNGTLVALAGGGGGTGGGHNRAAGGGGHAGVVKGAGAWAGQVGGLGIDEDSTATPIPGTTPQAYTFAAGPGGGGAGGTSAPGAAGVNPAHTGYNGTAGTARSGGNGGVDGSADQGGGGGAGYFGGGGGASTEGDVSGGNPNRGIVGGGGGGGSSFFSDATGAALTVPSATLGDGLAPAGAHRNGTAQIDWIPCNYDLSVTKVASSTVFEEGVPVDFTVTVKNEGPQPMGVDDTVTLVDNNAAGATLVSVTASDTADPAITCDVAPGDTMATGTLDCSRPVGAGTDVRGLNVGEELVIVYKKAFTGTAPVTNTVEVTDRGDQTNNAATAGLAVAVPSLKLTKTADRARITGVGQRVTYTFRVTNTGNIALHDIVINEGNFSGKGHLNPVCDTLPGGELAPGAVVDCKAVYKATKADVERGTIVNTATASGVTPGGAPVQSAPDSARVKAVVPPLPDTGGPNSTWLLGGGAAVLAGGVLMAAERRRKITS